ncbi:MAG: NUDIX hydrolase [Solirubrobacterales bacterium]
MDAHGTKEAGVLIPVYDHANRPGIVFTERRRDLPRHPGEISFPGGKPHAGEELLDTALRESDEEIALDPGAVDVVGALPPFSTGVTSYKVFPFVGLIAADLPLVPSPDEVERLVELRIDDLLAGFEMQRLVRRGIPFRTPTYTVGDDFIWGATARILQDFLGRLGST